MSQLCDLLGQEGIEAPRYPTPQDVVEDYVLLSPIAVGVLGTEATVTSPNNLAHMVHEFGHVRLPLAWHLKYELVAA